MGFKRGPNVVTDGLVMYLDAGNVKSFRGEPTFNKISGDFDTTFDSFSDGDNAGFLNQLGSGNYLGVSSFISYKGLKSLRINRGSGGTGRAYRTFSVSTGEFSSISAWVYSDVAGPFIALEYFGGDYNWGVAYNNNIHTGSGWELIWCRTLGGSTSPTTGYYFLHPSVNNFDTYWDNIQVENKQYNTSYVNGTRGATVATGGGLKDLSGLGNNGELINGPIYNSSNNGSIVFDGVNDNINIGNASNFLYNGVVTVNVWLTTSSVGSYKKIFFTGDAGTSNIRGLYFSIGGSPYNTYFGVTTNVGQNSANYNVDLPLNKFVNLCGTYDGSNIKLYINGELVALQSLTGLIGTGGIGRISGYDNNNETWNGKMGLFQIYNRALSESEIKQNYNATKQRFAI
jgi:hypothetical protein